jgi:hypothetical protein
MIAMAPSVGTSYLVKFRNDCFGLLLDFVHQSPERSEGTSCTISKAHALQALSYSYVWLLGGSPVIVSHPSGIVQLP